MKKERTILIIILGAVFLAILVFIILDLFNNSDEEKFYLKDFETCVAAGNPILETYPRQCRAPNGTIYVEHVDEPVPTGGGTDDYGCLGSAGYTYDEDLQVCMREWEFGPEERVLINLAVEEVGSTKGLTVLNITNLTCDDCHNVALRKDELTSFEVFIEKNKIFSVRTSIRCTEEDRDVRVCTQIREQVCAYPIKKSYGSSCLACKDANVDYYTLGDC